MLEFQQKRKVRKILYSWVTVLILCVIAIVFVRAAWNVYVKEAQSRDYLNQAQAELNKVSASGKSLSQSVASLETPAGIEADIRRKFRMVKPGEQIAVIIDDNASGSDNTASSTPSIWHRIVSFFGL